MSLFFPPPPRGAQRQHPRKAATPLRIGLRLTIMLGLALCGLLIALGLICAAFIVRAAH